MTQSDYIQLSISILTALSSICSVVICFLTVKTSRPSIIIQREKDWFKPQNIYQNYDKDGLAIMNVLISNNSSVPGEISEVFFKYKNKIYYAKNKYTTISKNYTIGVVDDQANHVDFEGLKAETPLIIAPYSERNCCFIFPNMPYIDEKLFKVRVKFRVCGRFFGNLFKHKSISVTFFPSQTNGRN